MGKGDAHLNRDQLRDVTLDDAELMRDVVTTLIDDTSRQMELLRTAIHDQDARRCMHLAHYSKGACANVGAATAAEILKDIERRAANHEFGACDTALVRLAEEVEFLRTEVTSL